MPSSVPLTLRALVAALLAVALLGVRPPAPAQAMPIEGYPSYQPQTRCSPEPKRGTLMLAEHLVQRYPGSSSSGIGRSCGTSGISEHKEGRAFDWRLDARSARDRAYAAAFLGRLLAADKRGNAHALARRMGVMYVIWNDHIWSSASGYRKRDYRHSACSTLRSCSPTLRHRDHMHISLSRAAARAETSWYRSRLAQPVPKPAPAPTPSPSPSPKPPAEPTPAPQPTLTAPPKQVPVHDDGVIDLRPFPYRSFTVPANGKVVETRFKVRAGSTYSLTTAGLYGFGGPDEVADAVCSWSPRQQAWTATPGRAVRRENGRLALVVNGSRPFGDSCRGSHRYRTELKPTRTGTLKVRVLAPASSRGRLTVVVGRKAANVSAALPVYPPLTPAPTYSSNPRSGPGLLAETVSLPASAPDARWTAGSLEPGAAYRVTVSGVVRLGGGVGSNGQCVSVGGRWYDAASVDPRVPGQDHGQLYLGGRPFQPTSGGCTSSTRVGQVVADERGRLRLDLWDPLERSNNVGELAVLVQRTSPVVAPVPAAAERPRPRRQAWKQRTDRFTVDSARRLGTISTMRVRKGQRVRVVATGRFTSAGSAADASCVRTGAGWKVEDPAVLVPAALSLVADGRGLAWSAPGAGRTCSADSVYRATLTATKSGPVRLSILDVDHADNEGSLQVSLRRLR